MNPIVAAILSFVLVGAAFGQPHRHTPGSPPPGRRTPAPPAPGRLEAALRTVAGERDLKMVRQLLEKGADPNGADEHGETALLAAVRGAHAPADSDPVPVLSLLIEKGSDVNARDAQGVTPLMAGADRHERPVIDLLLEKKADPGAADNEGRTVLMHAARTRLGADPGIAAEIVKRLLARQVDVKARDHTGWTALHHAVNQHLTEAGGTLSHPEVVAALIDGGAELDAHADDGSTPLLLALGVWRGPTEIVAVLLEKGADMNATDKAGLTPLIVGARMGKADEVRLLIARHADLNAKAREGDTPLLAAVEAGQAEVVQVLLGAGASLTGTPYKDSEEASHATQAFALMGAAERAEQEKVKELLDAGASLAVRDRQGQTALHRAAASYSGADGVVELLLARGADPNATDSKGDTPFILAATRHAHRSLDLLIGKGVDVNAHDLAGQTALLAAAEADDPTAVSILLEHRADAKARDGHGRGALAANVPVALDTRTMASLIKAGADVNVADDRGRTPLMEASGAANFDAAQLLVWRGADAAARDKAGMTALDIAVAARAKPDVAPANGDRLDEIISMLKRPPVRK